MKIQTQNPENQVVDAKLIDALKKIDVSTFVGIRNYTTKNNEIANYTLTLGSPLKNRLQKDYNEMQSNDFYNKVVNVLTNKLLTRNVKKNGIINEVTFKPTLADVDKAYNQLLNSYKARLLSKAKKAQLLAKYKQTKSFKGFSEKQIETIKTLLRSEAQTNAYTHICNGLKHKDSVLYVSGVLISKKSLVPGDEKKPVCSAVNTIVKKEIGYLHTTNRMNKFISLTLDLDETIKISGNELIRIK